ncbi:MAG: molecular chaperone DnaJ [Synechococcus sp. CPC35]|nr:molecular chaperone DnaJ [Synechococcus sp. CPC35]
MGFDPRQQQRVTTNVDSLLAENDALRREVQRLNRELDRLRQRDQRDSNQSQSSTGTPRRITDGQVLRWGQALARQPGWIGLQSDGLERLIERLNSSGFPSRLTLQQRLNRLVSGLGTDLMAALASSPRKTRGAVQAAFALYGVRASEWLEEDPRRVVMDLCRRQELDADSGGAGQTEETRRGRRTRTDRRSTDRRGSDRRSPHRDVGPGGARSEALKVLGLEPGATQQMIRKAYRRLVKQHHPDVGGSKAAFRRVHEAYQLLLG